MTAEIIAIGNELLSGSVLDTNSSYIINALKSVGISTASVFITGDDRESILRTLDKVNPKTNFVLVTGGLGPTHDDITMKTVADYFQSEIIFSDVAFERIGQLFDKRGFSLMKDINRGQAMVPEKAELIPNYHGTAQGLKFKKGETNYYFMPGVPVEMKKMIDEIIIPELRQQTNIKINTKVIHTTGIGESLLYKKIESWIDQNNHLLVSILPRFPEVDISLSYSSNNQPETVIQTAVSELAEILGNDVYGFDNDSLESVVAKLLTNLHLTIATAESCTGGLIANRLTDIPGSSDFFVQGMITYSNQAKIQELDVPAEIIEKYGAVSRETAIEMARNIRKIAGTSIGLSSTGIAGPAGGTDAKPVGTVFVGLSINDKEEVYHFLYNRDRQSNKLYFSQMALNQLRLALKGIHE